MNPLPLYSAYTRTAIIMLYMFALAVPLRLTAQDLPHFVKPANFKEESLNFGDIPVRTTAEKTVNLLFDHFPPLAASLDTVYAISEYGAFTVTSYSRDSIDMRGFEVTTPITIAFSTPHNIRHTGTVIAVINMTQSTFYGQVTMKVAVGLTVTGRGVFPEPSVLSFTQDVSDVALFDSLRKYVKGHTPVNGGYNRARDIMFEQLDIYSPDSSIRCAYTDSVVQAFGRTQAFQKHGFNTEHIWPQSAGADTDDPPGYDLNNLTITEQKVNAERASFPFDKVEGAGNCNSCGTAGSKLGKNSRGETVFEPRDEVKGNIARSIMYFQLRYGDNSNTSVFQFPRYENTLRAWTKNDPPNDSDIKRNEAVGRIQMRENPFISYPELIDRIYTISNERTPFPRRTDVFAPANIYFIGGGSATYINLIANKGNKSATVTSVKALYDRISVGEISEIPAFGYTELYVRGKDGGSGTDTIEVTLDDGTKVFATTQFYSTTSVDEQSTNTTCGLLLNITPNPGAEKVVFRVTTPDYISNATPILRVYSSTGELISDMSNQLLSGNKAIEFQQPAAAGMYFCRLTVGNCTITKPFILTK